MLNPAEAVEWTRDLLEMRASERVWLDEIHAYWRGAQALPIAPTGVPADVTRVAQMSRVNICGLAVDVPAQSMFVTGFRSKDEVDNSPTWDAWQANRMDRHQKGLWRSTLAYGTAYCIVMPGDTYPVISPKSPRQMTAAYEAGSDWAEVALEVVQFRGATEYRLYDRDARYVLREDRQQAEAQRESNWPVLERVEQHGAGVCPVVRFTNVEDLDGDPHSEIAPIIPLQDQLDFTTFGLLVAQHFAAFRQRYIIGWTSDSENEKAKASASRLWTFDKDPNEMTVGEFGQTDLKGYLDSRRSTQELFGVIAQVPPHNLLGQMINLSAEALVAAEAGHQRKLADLEVSAGESVEQVHWLTGRLMGVEVDQGAQTRWRESEARSLAQTVDALGKMVQMLNVPAEAAWERIPGVTQQDVERWRSMVESGTALDRFFADIERQMVDAG